MPKSRLTFLTLFVSISVCFGCSKFMPQPQSASQITAPTDVKAETSAYNGPLTIKVGGKYGYIDQEGYFIIPAKFEDVREFSQGLAAVKRSSKWGYIDKQGSVVVEPLFDNNALPFRAGIAQVRLSSGDLGYIDKSGEYVWKPAR